VSPSAELLLPYRPPFAAERLLSFFAARAIPGIEHVEGGTYRRSISTADGAGALIALTPDPDRDAVRLRVSGVDEDDQAFETIVQKARRLIDLDADPIAIDDALAADPALGPLVEAVPGTRVPGAVDGFELAVRAIVGQQVSVSGARTTLGRIVSRLGRPLASPEDGIAHRFPTPAAIAAASREDLPMPGARAEALRELARRVDGGELDVFGQEGFTATRESLASIRGVGSWTLGYIAMRLGDPDAYLTGDLGVRHGITSLGLPDDARSIAARFETWRPWRAYATMHLWQAGT
jgi:AraC family transcriptional regulator, regulatory protein of adaptative response / DNA-3-methyladenine glycosylase II